MRQSTPWCQIVPPYLLEAVATARHPHFAAAAAAARNSLARDAPLRVGRRRERHGLVREQLRAQRGGEVRGGTLREAVAPPRPAAWPAAPAQPTPGLPRRSIADAAGLELLPGATVRSEGDPPVDDRSVNEAYAGLGSSYALLWEALGRDSVDGENSPLEATVHYGTAYDNAFWNGSRMVFGDGDGQVFHNFTASLSVIGHELAHGVTACTAGLHYRDQSGALSEHVSDVFGALTEQFAHGQSAGQASWLIGAELFTTGVQGRALRDMLLPGTAYDDDVLGHDPQPSHMRDYITTTDDNGGVHLNSGIPNRAFALAALAIGGAAWKRAGRIWYSALTGGALAPDAGFTDFAAATLAEAERLHGLLSPEWRAVADGWDAVGIVPGASSDAGPDALPVALAEVLEETLPPLKPDTVADTGEHGGGRRSDSPDGEGVESWT